MGRIIGNRLDFRSLATEPVNEQGVVYLFGVLHDTFDFKIESIQTGFPDCLARRKITKDKWEELCIEFEFESKSFVAHNHDPNRVDIIVCWKHNWKECPDGIEVIELSPLIYDLENFQNDFSKNNKKLNEYKKFAREKRLDGYSFEEIAQMWKKAGKNTDNKGVKRDDKSLTEYQRFCREKRLEGKSFKEISKLWKEYKNSER